MQTAKSKSITDKITHYYTIDHLTMEEIGKLVGMGRQGVHKRLRAAGIASAQGEHVKFTCDFCGEETTRTRKNYKKQINHFCSTPCYHASIENPGYKPWRPGQRLARAIVNCHIKLLSGYVVHHKDGDNRNNNLNNLTVFKSQSDHLRYHRSGSPYPVWDGSRP